MAEYRMRNIITSVILLLLGVGNAAAAILEWYDSKGMLIFNGVCVVVLVVAVMHKVFSMEARKMWRILAFLLSSLGVLTVFCSQFLASAIEPWLITTLLAVGAVLLLLGGVSMVRWRRCSFDRKEQLQKDRNK